MRPTPTKRCERKLCFSNECRFDVFTFCFFWIICRERPIHRGYNISAEICARRECRSISQTWAATQTLFAHRIHMVSLPESRWQEMCFTIAHFDHFELAEAFDRIQFRLRFYLFVLTSTDRIRQQSSSRANYLTFWPYPDLNTCNCFRFDHFLPNFVCRCRHVKHVKHIKIFMRRYIT